MTAICPSVKFCPSAKVEARSKVQMHVDLASLGLRVYIEGGQLKKSFVRRRWWQSDGSLECSTCLHWHLSRSREESGSKTLLELKVVGIVYPCCIKGPGRQSIERASASFKDTSMRLLDEKMNSGGCRLDLYMNAEYF